MADKYNRLCDIYRETTKQDTTAFAEHLWRLKVTLKRVQRIGPYLGALTKHTIDHVVEKTRVVAKNIQNFRDRNLNYGERAIQLGPLRETVKKLDDTADDIEYTRCKQRQENSGKKLYHATNIIQRLRLILKLRKAEELLKDLLVILADFQAEYKSEEASTSSNPQDQHQSKTFPSRKKESKTARHSSAGQNDSVSVDMNKIKAQLLDQGGDTVIPFEVAQNTGTVYDIFHDQDIRGNFGSLIRVRASDKPMTSHGTLAESILELMNSYVVNIDVPLHTQKCGKCTPCLKKEAFDGSWLIKKGKVKREPEPGGLTELRYKFCQLKNGQEKLLLVLEDVLEDQLPQLVHLLYAMLGVNSESRILLSSQSSEVMQSVRGIRTCDGEIKHDIHGKFFKKFAFREAKEGENEQMNSMAETMAGYLKNFPLAAKMVGKMLSKNQDHKFWAAILGKLSRTHAECERLQLSSLLKICYDELEAPQRLCFQYCSLFPNNWKFTSEKLVQLWMSQSFLDEALGRNNLEDLGNSYLEDLCSRSFFEKRTSDGPRSLHTLHTSVHCFAEFTAGEEFMRIESHIQPEKSQHIRHLSVKSTNLSALLNVDALYRLRTLIIFGPVSSDASDILQHILPRLKNTRTIDLAGCDMKAFPQLDKDLKKHLRYLSIYDAEIHTLPHDLCEFLHLQVLNVEGSRLKKLPQKMTRLCNLRHISGPTFLTSAVTHIGKLKALQELQEFAVSKKHKIKELGRIKELGGSISITNLERVTCKEAARARLHEKKSISSLKLEWSSTVMHSSSVCWYDTMAFKSWISAKVLERLKPSNGIHILEINRYIGAQYPSWFSGVFENLESITLRNCKNLVGPLPFGQFLGLRRLKLETWEKLTSFSLKAEDHLQKLIELHLEDMPELKDWEDSHTTFSALKLLTIRNCPKLKSVPLPEPSLLERIHLEDCRELSFAAKHLPSTLLHLRITACGKRKESNPDDDVTASSAEGSLSLLQTVHVDDISLLKSHYEHLVSLKELVIEGGIKDTLSCLPTLRKLYLIKCQDKALPNDMKEFSSLKSLHLKQCNKMESLPDLPYSLVELCIDECPLLETHCREHGPGWSNISHIPYKYI